MGTIGEPACGPGQRPRLVRCTRSASGLLTPSKELPAAADTASAINRRTSASNSPVRSKASARVSTAGPSKAHAAGADRRPARAPGLGVPLGQ